jgi:hypothetical protein
MIKLDTVVTFPWRPDRPVTVNSTMYENAIKLRPALIVTAILHTKLTYKKAAIAIDWDQPEYRAQSLGPLLDLISYDCIERGEPPLAPLVVRSDTDEVGDGFVGDPVAGREDCYSHWSAKY